MIAGQDFYASIQADGKSITQKYPVSHILVWDAPTRICYGLLLTCLTGIHVTAEQEEFEKVHATLSETAGALALFRLMWGLIGTRYARFTEYFQGAASIRAHLQHLPCGWAKRHLSHSPTGALFVIGSLVATVAASLLGLVGDQVASGEWILTTQDILYDLVLSIGLAYMVGAMIGSWRAGENLWRASFLGRKTGCVSESITNPMHGIALLLASAVLIFWAYRSY